MFTKEVRICHRGYARSRKEHTRLSMHTEFRTPPKCLAVPLRVTMATGHATSPVGRFSLKAFLNDFNTYFWFDIQHTSIVARGSLYNSQYLCWIVKIRYFIQTFEYK